MAFTATQFVDRGIGASIFFDSDTPFDSPAYSSDGYAISPNEDQVSSSIVFLDKASVGSVGFDSLIPFDSPLFYFDGFPATNIFIDRTDPE